MKFMSDIGSVIQTIQSNKILEKLEKRKESGEIRTEADFRAEMKRELIAIRSNDTASTFKFIGIPYDRAYSEYLNSAFDGILLDLEVAFFEVNNLFSKIASHDVFFEKTLTEIEKLTVKLEEAVEASAIEAGLDTAFNKVVSNKFADNTDKILEGNKFFHELYFDKRLREKVTKQHDAEVNTNKRALELAKFTNNDVAISAVNIIETETSSSEYDIQMASSNISNVLSDSSSEAWFFNVNSEENLQEGASLALEIDMGDKKKINSFRIKPNAETPMYLEAISYQDEADNTVSLFSTPELIEEEKVVSFPTAIGRRFKIVFKQYTSYLMEYNKNASKYTLEDLQSPKQISPTLDMVSGIVSSEISDPVIKNIIGLTGNQIEDNRTLNNYVFSFERISVGFSDFKEYGVFISKERELKTATLIGIESDSEIAQFQHKISDGLMDFGSIEYSLFKTDFNGVGKRLRTKEFNILPLGSQEVRGEKLNFTSSDKVLPLRFLSHLSDGDGSSVVLYRDGVELLRGVDWRFAKRLNISNDADSFLESGLDSTQIEILNANTVIEHSSYTANYTPRYMVEELRETVDNGLIYLPSGAVSFASDVFGERIEYSKLFLKIIIRSNTNQVSASPSIKDYKILIKEENNEQ